MAQRITILYEHPEPFSPMFEVAAKRVRKQSDAEYVIRVELYIALGD